MPGRDAPASVRLVDDDAFLLHVGDRLAGLPAVEAARLRDQLTSLGETHAMGL